jgi:hypothetical protein
MTTGGQGVDIGALVKIYKEAMKKGDSHRVELTATAIKVHARAEAALAEARILSRVAIDV